MCAAAGSDFLEVRIDVVSPSLDERGAGERDVDDAGVEGGKLGADSRCRLEDLT
jgi:hypothetical protein